MAEQIHEPSSSQNGIANSFTPPLNLTGDNVNTTADSRPVLQYRKPGWRLRTFVFESKVREYPTIRMRAVSYVQMIVGLMCLGLSVAVIAVEAWGYQYGVGIWGGALFMLAGGIGLVAYISFKLGFILITFLLSVASFVTAFVLFVVSCIGIEQDSQDLQQIGHIAQEQKWSDEATQARVELLMNQHRMRIGFNATLLVMAMFELAIAMLHAMLNAKHFFVYDNGSTSETEYVYSNEGAEIGPDLPPTYQEAVGATASVTAEAAGVSYSQQSDPMLRAQQFNNATTPVGQSLLYSNVTAYTGLSPAPVKGGDTGNPGHSGASYARPQSLQPFQNGVHDRPPAYNGDFSVHYQKNAPNGFGEVKLGRGQPQGMITSPEPMYQRPTFGKESDAPATPMRSASSRESLGSNDAYSSNVAGPMYTSRSRDRGESGTTSGAISDRSSQYRSERDSQSQYWSPNDRGRAVYADNGARETPTAPRTPRYDDDQQDIEPVRLDVRYVVQPDRRMSYDELDNHVGPSVYGGKPFVLDVENHI